MTYRCAQCLVDIDADHIISLVVPESQWEDHWYDFCGLPCLRAWLDPGLGA